MYLQSTLKGSNVEETSKDRAKREEVAQIQKRGILKNAVAMPVLKLSPIHIDSATGDTDIGKVGAKPSVSDTPASPTPEATADHTAKPLRLGHESKIENKLSSSRKAPVIESRPVRSKKIVDIAEVLRRGKLAAAEKAAEKSADKVVEPAKEVEESKADLEPRSPQEPDEPASPTKSVGELLSPISHKTPTIPKVIPLIPLSPTRDSSAKDVTKPLSIPLSPTKANHREIPLSSPALMDDSHPTSPTSETRSLAESMPRTIPLSPTSLRSVASQEHLRSTPASPPEQLAESKEVVTAIAPTPESPVELLSPEVPTFMVVTTDDDDSDNEPMLSIAEETPTKDVPTTGAIEGSSKPPMDEALKIQPIVSAIKDNASDDSASLKDITGVASAENDSQIGSSSTGVDQEIVNKVPEEVCAEESPSAVKSPPMPVSLSPVFGLASSTFGRASDSLALGLFSTASSTKQPAVLKEELSKGPTVSPKLGSPKEPTSPKVNLEADPKEGDSGTITDEGQTKADLKEKDSESVPKDIADDTPTSPLALAEINLPTLYIPIIPCDKIIRDNNGNTATNQVADKQSPVMDSTPSSPVDIDLSKGSMPVPVPIPIIPQEEEQRSMDEPMEAVQQPGVL